MLYTRFDTPFCEIILAGDEEGLTHLDLNTGKGRRNFEISDNWRRNDDFFSSARKQVEEYFCKKRSSFELALNPKGTDFQKRAWGELLKIPYGKLKTYKEIASDLGNEKAARAVGLANSKNPIPLIIPCHRVVGSDGSLTGFAHGIEFKQRLIQFEQSR